MRVPYEPDPSMALARFSPRLLALALALTAFHGTAQAKRDEPVSLALPADATSIQLAEQRKQIEGALQDPDDYAELRASDRTQVRDSLDQMAGQLEAAGSLAALSDADRAALLSRQEEVNAILATAYDDSRTTCIREQQMGSNFRRSVCKTVAERRRLMEQSKMSGQQQP